jgi:hypothetical protein
MQNTGKNSLANPKITDKERIKKEQSMLTKLGLCFLRAATDPLVSRFICLMVVAAVLLSKRRHDTGAYAPSLFTVFIFLTVVLTCLAIIRKKIERT